MQPWLVVWARTCIAHGLKVFEHYSLSSLSGSAAPWLLFVVPWELLRRPRASKKDLLLWPETNVPRRHSIKSCRAEEGRDRNFAHAARHCPLRFTNLRKRQTAHDMQESSACFMSQGCLQGSTKHPTSRWKVVLNDVQNKTANIICGVYNTPENKGLSPPVKSYEHFEAVYTQQATDCHWAQAKDGAKRRST